jgi:hypothetical protein
MTGCSLFKSRVQKGALICIWISVVLLAASAVSKLISAGGSARILSEVDPIFGLTNQQLFLWLGIIEAVVVIAVVRTQSVRIKLLLLAGLSTEMLLYRAGLLWLGVPNPCPCLGNAAAWFHLDPNVLDSLLKAGFAWLLGTSYGFLFLVPAEPA